MASANGHEPPVAIGTPKEYTLQLTQEELALLWQVLQGVNIPGAVAEIYVALKAKVRPHMQVISETQVLK